MANKSKSKGDRFERSLVTRHREEGYFCERTLEKGARSDGSETWDIDLLIAGQTLKVECKHRNRIGLADIKNWLNGPDVLVVKSDRMSPVYCVDEDMWFEMLKRIEKGYFNDPSHE